MGDTQKYQSKVKVLVRVRPYLADESRTGCIALRDKTLVELTNPKFQSEVTKYKFDGCYGPDATQEEIFNNEIIPVLGSVFSGMNTTIFAYGMTGAGKTHTMQGNSERPGIIPRVAEHLLKLIRDRETTEASVASGTYVSSYSLNVSYLEIYNEKVYDLLRPREQDLPVREDANRNIIIQGLEQLPVTTFDSFRQTYNLGCKNRTTAETKLNSTSSRSHALIILKLTYTEQAAPFRTFTSKINLIDLAGSEDNRRTNNTGVRMLESSAINTSLFVLGKVVDALNENSLRVPYRDSKLTRMLQDSLGGKSYAMLIANIAAGSNHFFETTNTLNFASKSRQVVNNPVANAVERPVAIDIHQQLEAFRKMKQRGMSLDENKENSTKSAGNVLAQKTQPQKKSVTVLDTPGIEARIEQKVTQKLKELQKRELLSPFIRSKNLLQEETQARLERLEQRLNGQEVDRALEGLGDDEEAEAVPAAALSSLTPFTKTKTIKDLILKAKTLENQGSFAEALSTYRKALELINKNPTEKEGKIATKLQKKIKKLEKVTNTGAMRVLNFTAVAEGEDPHDGNYVPPPASNNDSTGSEANNSANSSEGSNNGSRKRSSSSPNTTLSKKRSKESPKETGPITIAPADEARLLQVLNSGTLVQILDLWGIGSKKASLIMSRRTTTPLQSLEDLRECGFGPGQLETFAKRNSTISV